jgi:hypothetical protein
MNRSYSKIRHIQESNLIIEQRIIMEQSDAWSSVEPIGGDQTGAKKVLNDFTPQPLVNPKEGAVKFQYAPNRPLFISAKLNMFYNPRGGKDVANASESLNAKFGFDLEFYLTYSNVPATYISDKNNIFRIKCAKTKTGFQFLVTDIRSNDLQKLRTITDNDIKLKKSSELSGFLLQDNSIFGDLDGWCGNLRGQINIVLDKYGYPQVPNKINLGYITA